MAQRIGSFKTVVLSIDASNAVATLRLARPDKSNAVTLNMLEEISQALKLCEGSVRALVLHAEGKNFCGGLDFEALGSILQVSSSTTCPGAARDALRVSILAMQDAITSIERFRWPVVCTVHGACVGAGIDIITACDVRICTASARFCVKEVDLGITADLGTLQRLPHVVGEARTRELALTARTFGGADALAYGLVTSCHDKAASALERALATAHEIARKPPLAVAGTKRVLLDTRDKSVSDGLRYVAIWNSAQLLSNDLERALARAGRQVPMAAPSKL